MSAQTYLESLPTPSWCGLREGFTPCTWYVNGIGRHHLALSAKHFRLGCHREGVLNVTLLISEGEISVDDLGGVELG